MQEGHCSKFLIGINLGTSSVKAVMIDDRG